MLSENLFLPPWKLLCSCRSNFYLRGMFHALVAPIYNPVETSMLSKILFFCPWKLPRSKKPKRMLVLINQRLVPFVGMIVLKSQKLVTFVGMGVLISQRFVPFGGIIVLLLQSFAAFDGVPVLISQRLVAFDTKRAY